MKYAISTIGLTLWLALHAAAEPVDFVRDVRPIFAKHCYACHGAEKQKSGLRLDVKAAAFKGGELYDASILANKAKESPLIQFVADEDADLQMPPEERLSKQEIATLTRWVNEGAAWPDGVDEVTLTDPRDHWSFQALTHPTPPEMDDSSWPRSDIDRFILAKLKQTGLTPAPPSDRVAWLRRVYFDLTGLPPTPDQVAAFLADKSDSAWANVVDELLKSPRYGERWAQHWLDVVRYADTHGFEVNTERPHAWPYRDYVIRSFNNDTPYDRFIREQIAGDAMQQDAATGFLVTASVLLPGQIGKDPASKRLARQDSIDEIVTNIGQTFLGLSVGCARCHDHKFDPISQEDYYSMQAFVSGVEYKDRPLHTEHSEENQKQLERLKQDVAKLDLQLTQFSQLARTDVPRDSGEANVDLRPPVNARGNVDRFAPIKASRLRFTILETMRDNFRQPCIDELEVFDADGRNIALASAGTTVTSTGSNISANRHELRFINDGIYGNSRSWMSNRKGRGQVTLTFAKAQTVDRVIWGRDREGKFNDRLATDYRIEVADEAGHWHTVASAVDRASFVLDSKPSDDFLLVGLDAADLKQASAVLTRRKNLRKQIHDGSAGLLVFGGKFREPDPISLLRRGDPEQPVHPVHPAVPAAFGSLQLPQGTVERQRRKTLADWIASPEHPLTARVMVNRIWQGHFGRGLVETANDFGNSGQSPSHPALLDWLATEFIRSGWSVKQMHRLIVLSATYRQATRHDDIKAQRSAKTLDADARLLSRYPIRRLDGESIRDSMLAVSGELNLKMYGRGYDLFNKRGGLSGFKPVSHFDGEGLRRMIYAHKVRRERDGVFGAFDCPDAGQSTPRRRESTTPIQALNLFNSTFTLERADAFAARVTANTPNISEQIDQVYELALSRGPDAAELADAEPIVKQHGLSTLCRVLFNSNEFLFMP